MKPAPSRFVAGTLLVAAVGLLASCEEPSAPSAPQDTGISAARPGGPPPEAAPEGKINQLLTALVPPSEKKDTNDLFAEIKSSLAQGDTDAARDAMFDLVDLLLSLEAQGELQDPKGSLSTEDALVDLLDLLFEFVGLTAPSSNQNLGPILTGSVDGAVEVVGPGGGTVTTNTEFAGVDVPQGALDDEVLVIIQRNDVQDAEDCLPTPLMQAEGCYIYDTEPALGDVNQQDAFNVDVIVGVCLDPAVTGSFRDRFLLHKFDPENPQDGVIPLDNEDATFLSCGGFTASLPSSWWGELARGSWDALQEHVSPWFNPRPLWAINKGLGGSTGSFTTFGWAEAGTLSAFSGTGQSVPAGAVLPDPVSVELDGAHGPAGVIEDIPVTFEVAAGGGSVSTDGGQNFATQVSDTTDSDGVATFTWKTGSTVGAQSQEVVARLPGADPDSVLLTASTTSPISWQSVPMPTSSEILDIWALGNDTLWVTTAGGEILRSGDAGSSWAFTQPAGFGAFWGVWGTGSDTTWVVGEDAEQLFTTDGGATWVNALSGTAGVDTAFSVWGTDVDSVFVAGTDSVHFSTGLATLEVLSTQPAGSFREVWGLNPVELWAVGTDGTAGEIWTSVDEGNNWTLENPTNTPDAALYWSVWSSSTSNAFAVGEDAQGSGGLVAQNTGAGWFRATATSSVLRDIYGTGPSVVYAVGGAGTVLFYDGTDWIELAKPTAASLRAVWITPDGTVWVGGTGGTLLEGTP